MNTASSSGATSISVRESAIGWSVVVDGLTSEQAWTMAEQLLRQTGSMKKQTADAATQAPQRLIDVGHAPGMPVAGEALCGATAKKITICTDGSCWPNPGPGGWAFCVFQDAREIDTRQGSERRTTNNRMEITAVLEALRWLEANRPPSAVEILSDSQYVVNGVTKWRFGWRKRGWRKGKNGSLQNADLWQAIDPLAERLSFELRWTRGHSGHAGNERADQLAEQARMGATAP